MVTPAATARAGWGEGRWVGYIELIFAMRDGDSKNRNGGMTERGNSKISPGILKDGNDGKSPKILMDGMTE